MSKPSQIIIVRDTFNLPGPYIEATPRAYGSLTKVCRAMDWKYNTLSRKKFPFEYKGFRLDKVKLN